MAELFYNGRRIDGRRVNELRNVVCQFEIGNSDGIVLLHQGNTKVMASVVGPHPCRFKGDMKPEEALIVCKYSKPPFSSTSGERKKLSSRDRSSNDFASAIEEIFTCVVRKDKYPMSQIDIFLEVLQSDGSEFSCAVNATTLALTDAGIEMKHLVCAVTVGLWGSHIFADLCRFEENPRVPHLTMVSLQSMDPVTARERELGDATGVKTQPPPQVLHTRLSSWLPAAKLNDLSAAAMEVSKTLNAEFASWLRGRVRSTTDVK
ncbi:Exosome complex component RRP41 [Fasciolopsis buskii]|uniref:Exosome complex component RRP41 n=1 Tax=Fasciolopsis buskii TaxID=27845 RepID=A0A8E0RKL9_9TREM|nr:Exosome complex component RRP41 [Fasciolopsis buski]